MLKYSSICLHMVLWMAYRGGFVVVGTVLSG